VLSRSVVVTLEGVDSQAGAKYIATKLDDVDYEDALNALKTFNGNIGKTIDSFSDGGENEIATVCCDICKALVDDNEYSLLCACSAFQNDRSAIVFACDYMKNIFRDALIYHQGGDCLSGKPDIAKLLKNKLTKQKLVDLIDVCDKLKEMALMNSNNSILITKICYSLREAIGR
jgi:hypothetical protein